MGLVYRTATAACPSNNKTEQRQLLYSHTMAQFLHLHNSKLLQQLYAGWHISKYAAIGPLNFLQRSGPLALHMCTCKLKNDALLTVLQQPC